MAHPQALYPVMTPVNGIVELSGSFIVGATGAVPTSGGANGNGLSGFREMGTPVRNGVGDYSFPLSQTWLELVEFHCDVVGAHSTTTGKYSECIADSVTSNTAPLVRFQFTRGDTGAAAEVAQNDVLKVRLILRCKD